MTIPHTTDVRNMYESLAQRIKKSNIDINFCRLLTKRDFYRAQNINTDVFKAC